MPRNIFDPLIKKATDRIISGKYYNSTTTIYERLATNVDYDFDRFQKIIMDQFDNPDGVNVYDLTRILESEFYDGDQKAAYRTARTTLSDGFNLAGVEAAKDNDMVGGLEWILANDDNPCDECVANSEEDNGYGPGVWLPDEVPDSHPNCMCTLAPVLNEEMGLPDGNSDGTDSTDSADAIDSAS